MKKPAARALLLLLFVLTGCSQPPGYISGTVSVNEELKSKAGRPNSVLFVVAKNQAGIPVAVRKIINPVFPQSFYLGPEELVLPGSSWEGPFELTAQVNTHGILGSPRAGDIGTADPVIARNGDGGIRLVLDKIY